MPERSLFYGLRPGMIFALARLGLWKKLGNYLLAEWDLRQGRETARALPYHLIIDPASACTLRCPFCPTGRDKGTRPKTLLRWDDYVKVMDQLGPYLLKTDFYNWGEPTLNPRLYDMIAYAKRFYMETYLSSHLNDLDEEAAGRLLHSGLDFLILSFDGASQETYSRYRAGGDFDKALKNLRTLLDLRRRRGSRRPYIAWKFLVFRHNEHEIEKARAMSAELGVDLFLPAPAAIPDPAWVPVKEGAAFYPETGAAGAQTMLNHQEYLRVKASGLPACVWPWLAAVVNSDGSVSPCCGVEDKKDDFGDGLAGPLRELFNNRSFKEARAFLAKGRRPAGANVCAACAHAGKINPLVPSWWRSGGIRDLPLTRLLRPNG
jgi:MoaA/NifB/PqqE/SkfB family radical SAM enzyme